MICSPGRCVKLVKGILEARERGERKMLGQPLFVWEPVPDLCVPEELENALEALRYVDVVSPNEGELAALFGEHGEDASGVDAVEGRMQRQCEELLTRGFGGRTGAVVVRTGKEGCYVATKERHTLFPAYHRENRISKKTGRQKLSKVVDPTGGGNAFLGGFCMGVLQGTTRDATAFEDGALFGTIAASFAIEQVGMPKLSGEEEDELWNGKSVAARLEKFRSSLPVAG